jgi:hypothetical protein
MSTPTPPNLHYLPADAPARDPLNGVAITAGETDCAAWNPTASPLAPAVGRPVTVEKTGKIPYIKNNKIYRRNLMKKSISVLFCALLSMNFFSCGTSNAAVKDSVDWAGVYTGVIPAADAEGINVEITLRTDGTYGVTYQYIGKGSDVLAHTGAFKWKTDGSTVVLDVLDTDGIPPYYVVGENTLTQLDMKGKRITGALANNYVLKKK